MKMANENNFEKAYKISMPLSGLASSWFEADGKKFAYMDYDVKKGLKWEMKFYSDEEKKNAFIEIVEQKNSLLDGGYAFKDAVSGEQLGVWAPKKRFLNLFLRAPYTLTVNGKVVAMSPGEGFFKLFVPGKIRSFLCPRKVLNADGKPVAKISTQSTFGCGITKVKPCGENTISESGLGTAVAVLAAICGLQD